MTREEAISKIKTWDFLDNDEKEVLETLIPELKESEDELTWLTRFIEEEAYSLSMDVWDNEDRIKLRKLQSSLAWLKKQGEKSDYNPYKETVKSISIMVEKYVQPGSDLQDFYDNVKVKCKDAMKYEKTWLEKQRKHESTDLDVLNYIRKETCCGLAEANNALLELIKVLKEHPSYVMDKSRKLKIEWEEQ